MSAVSTVYVVNHSQSSSLGAVDLIGRVYVQWFFNPAVYVYAVTDLAHDPICVL
jgi:hypothetical protein